ncbi:hypothetical protein BJX64DRAFT_289594 [Aspergillus heterothallicus]
MSTHQSTPGCIPDHKLDDASHLTIYLGTSISPRNMFFLVLATPDFSDSIYQIIVESQDGKLGWVYKNMNFPFAPIRAGESPSPPLFEISKPHPSLRERVFSISSAAAKSGEPWTKTFLFGLETERIVPKGTRIEFSKKRMEYAKRIAGERNTRMDVEDTGDDSSTGGVMEWIRDMGYEGFTS